MVFSFSSDSSVPTSSTQRPISLADSYESRSHLSWVPFLGGLLWDSGGFFFVTTWQEKADGKDRGTTFLPIISFICGTGGGGFGGTTREKFYCYIYIIAASVTSLKVAG